MMDSLLIKLLQTQDIRFRRGFTCTFRDDVYQALTSIYLAYTHYYLAILSSIQDILLIQMLGSAYQF